MKHSGRLLDLKGRQARDVRQAFGNLPVIEADANMLVYVSRAELDQSTRGDPANCMFANACKRAFGSKAVLFYPTVAYVDTLDSDGNRVVMRFRVTQRTREAIERFDSTEGKNIEAEATFMLYAVPPTNRLSHRAKQQRRRKREIAAGRKVNKRQSEAAKRGAAKRLNKALTGLRVGSPGGGLA